MQKQTKFHQKKYLEFSDTRDIHMKQFRTVIRRLKLAQNRRRSNRMRNRVRRAAITLGRETINHNLIVREPEIIAFNINNIHFSNTIVLIIDLTFRP